MKHDSVIEPSTSGEKETVKTVDKRKPLKLSSPGGRAPFLYPFNAEMNHVNALDIIDLIRSVLSDHPQINEAISKHFKLEEVDVRNYSTIRSLCKKFNKAVNHMLKNASEPPVQTPMSKELLRQVVTRCYNKAVVNEKSLNKHYEAFSSQTYGETSYERMQMILDEIQPTGEDVFIDLGSGVGQLVVHVAGAARVKRAVGIEIAQLPSRFAAVLESEFKRHVDWHGKSCIPFQLEQGDFLDEKWRELITQEATIIFINNYAFQSDLETRIKMELLHELKDGTRIITTKPYVPLHKTGAITDRQMNDISVIIDITELRQCPNPCSWTSADVPYYMHVINRAKLERYFLSRNPALRGRSNDGGNSRRSITPTSKNSSNSRESSVGLKEGAKSRARSNGSMEESGYGPTTRRRWQEYVIELDQKKVKKRGNAAAEKNDSLAADDTSTADCLSDNKEEDSEGSVPRKKQRRNSDKTKTKDKSFRGRPRKSDSSKDGMSEDAKEGIELMHQMTKAVSSGDTVDAAAILADLTNQGTETIRLSDDRGDDVAAVQSTSFPLTDCDSNRQSAVNVTAESSLEILRNWRSDIHDEKKKTTNTSYTSTRFPNLDIFLSELRHLYENFLDSMQTPEFVNLLSAKIESEKKVKRSLENSQVRKNVEDTPVKQKGGESAAADQLEWTSSMRARFAERSKRLAKMQDEITAKSKDLDDSIRKYNMEMAQFTADLQKCDAEPCDSGNVNEKLDTENADKIQQLQKELIHQKQLVEVFNAVASECMRVNEGMRQEWLVEQQQRISTQPSTSNTVTMLPNKVIEKLLMSDMAHIYAQQPQSQPPLPPPLFPLPRPSQALPHNNPLLMSQLTQFLSTNQKNGQMTPTQPSPMAADPSLHRPQFNGVNDGSAATSSMGTGVKYQSVQLPTDAPLQHVSEHATQQAPHRTVENQHSVNPLAQSNAPREKNSEGTERMLNIMRNLFANNFGTGGGTGSVASSEGLISHPPPQQQQQSFIDYNHRAAVMTKSNLSMSPALAQQRISHQQPVMMGAPSSALSSMTYMTAGTSRDSRSLDAIVTAVASGNAKKTTARPKSSRMVSQSGIKQQQKNSAMDEQDVEQKIKDIVEKVLLVDHVAKQSEKERRARSFERRREKCSASLSIATSNYAGASANVNAAYSAGTPTKRNSSDVYSSGSATTTNNFDILSPISTNAGNSSFGGSAAGSAIASPVAQNFVSSAASACAQLLSTAANSDRLVGGGNDSADGSAMKQPIAIVSVAPPPHSPPIGVNSAAEMDDTVLEPTAVDQPLHISTTASDEFSVLNNTVNDPSRIGIAHGTFLTIDTSSMNGLLIADSAMNTKSLVEEEIQSANALAKSTSTFGGNKTPLLNGTAVVVSPHTPYVPLSKRTVIENFSFSLPADGATSSDPLAKSSRHLAPFIKTENEDSTSR